MNKDKVSVIIPVYNGEQYLREAVESVRAQTYTQWELICVDDGSADGSNRILSEYADGESVILIEHRENRGIPAARNTGIEASSGEYIAFLDQDDVWLPEKLEKQMIFLNRPEHRERNAGLCYTNYEMFGDAERGAREMRRYSKDNRLRNRKTNEKVYRDLVWSSFIVPSSALVYRHCFDTAGVFDEHIRNGCDDHDMWIRISEHYALAYLDTVLIKVRIHQKNFTNQVRFFSDRLFITDKLYSQDTISAGFKRKKDAFVYYRKYYYHFGRSEYDEAFQAIRKAVSLRPYSIRYAAVYLLFRIHKKGCLIRCARKVSRLLSSVFRR